MAGGLSHATTGTSMCGVIGGVPPWVAGRLGCNPVTDLACLLPRGTGGLLAAGFT